MRQILAEIKDGSFAQRFIDDQDAGGPEFKALREKGERTRSSRPVASCAS
jgi:ketol-acid reductoisomerase